MANRNVCPTSSSPWGQHSCLPFPFCLPFPSLLLLVRRPDHDNRAVEAGDGPVNEQQVVLGVDPDYAQIADGHSFSTITTGKAFALLGPTAAAVAGQRRRGARFPVHLLGAMSARHAAKAVPF